MGLADRDYMRGEHPPTCTCAECNAARLSKIQSGQIYHRRQPFNTNKMIKRIILTVVLLVLVGSIIAAFCGIQPFSNIKASIESKFNSNVHDSYSTQSTIPKPSLEISSILYLGGYDIGVYFVPQNVVADTNYRLILYERGVERAYNDIIFTDTQLTYQQIVDIDFSLTADDLNGIHQSEYMDIFTIDIIVKPTSTTVATIHTTTHTNTHTTTTTNNLSYSTNPDSPFAVQSIYVESITSTLQEDSYRICVTLKPNAAATLNKSYMVALYENGVLRASTTYNYRYNALNSISTNVCFGCSSEEYQQYSQQTDLSSIFSVQIIQHQ